MNWQGNDFAYWLPDWALDTVGNLRLSAGGHLLELEHAGVVHTDRVALPNGESVALRLNWQGVGQAVEHGVLIFRHPDLEAGMEFSLSRHSDDWTLVAPLYRIQHQRLPEMFSYEPMRVVLQLVAGQAPSLQVQGLSLRDSAGETRLGGGRGARTNALAQRKCGDCQSVFERPASFSGSRHSRIVSA
ncbi:MAG: hypothetical protein LR015_05455 [Verrucomicrobia bacterium]|nr:hypothetical protein [Verrucomicrobiota bacterium]